MDRFALGFQIRDLTRELAQSLPNILAAAALVLVGWALALLLRFLSRRATESGLKRLGRDSRVRDTLEAGGMRRTIAQVVGAFAFWLVFLLFLAAALERLGLPVFTGLVGQVTYYLPNVLAAVLIVLGGVIVGKLAGGAVTTGAASAGLPRAPALGRAVQVAVFLVAAVVGLEQIGIRGQLLVVILAVVFATFLGGAGLAFGLGARTAVSNIIASHYVAQAYRAGQVVRIGDIEGRIVETTRTAVLLNTGEGRVLVPAQRFSEETSILLTEASSHAG